MIKNHIYSILHIRLRQLTMPAKIYCLKSAPEVDLDKNWQNDLMIIG